MRTLCPIMIAVAGGLSLGQPASATWPTDPSIDAIVADEAFSQREYHAIPDETGGAYVTWMDTRLGVNSPRVYVQRISADGDMLWTDDGILAADGGGPQRSPRIALDNAGGVVVVWEDQRDERDTYAQRFDAVGTKLWPETGLAVSTEFGAQYRPRVMSDPAGGVFVAWNDGRSAAGGYEDIYGQRLAPDGTELWAAGGRTIFASWAAERIVRLAPDGAGGVICVTSDLSRDWLRARRLTSTGADVWGGVLNFTTEAMNYPAFEVAPDGVGGVFVVWRSTWNDLKGQYLDAAGTKQWNGGLDLEISPISPTRAWQDITPDGAGGVYIGWADSRLVWRDLFVQRMSPTGVRMWGDEAIHVGPMQSSLGPALVADSSGNLLASWVDGDDGGIRAQKITPAGVIEWSAGGEVVSSSPGGTFDDPHVCLTLDDGIIVVFEDFPGTYADLHAKKIASDGNLGEMVGIGDVADGVVPISTWPNPFRTYLQIGVPENTDRVTVFDVSGRTVRNLDAVAGQVEWDGRNVHGHQVAPGVYLISAPWRCERERDEGRATSVAGDQTGSLAKNRIPSKEINMRSWIPIAAAALIAGLAIPDARAEWEADGTPISTASGRQDRPVMLPDGAGGAFIAWTDSRGGDIDIYVQRADADGNSLWTPDGIPVVEAPGTQGNPVLAPDGIGGVLIAWIDRRGGGTQRDIYFQRYSAAGGRYVARHGIPIVVGTIGATGFLSLDMVTDRQGGAILSWRQEDIFNNTDVHAQRINGLGATYWQAGGVQILSGGGFQREPSIVTDGQGGAIVIWWDEGFEIMGQRLNPSGLQMWLNGEFVLPRQISHGAADPVDLDVASDGEGGAFVTWEDDRNGLTDIYAQNITFWGTLPWGTTDTPVCNAQGTQSDARVCMSAPGSAIVTWQDTRTGDEEIYAQRVSNAGAAHWGTNGRRLSDGYGPAIAPDGADGAIIAWIERSGPPDFDLYAQRVDIDGDAQWTPDGEPVSTAVGDQRHPSIIAGDEAIIAWTDSRVSSQESDIYALQVPLPVVGVEAATPAAGGLRVLGAAPNPFRSRTSLRLELTEKADVRVDVFDPVGRRVMSRAFAGLAAGIHALELNTRGTVSAPGVYHYRVRAQGTTATGRIVLAR